MQYGDLNLKKIRDDNGLDFAHFTYQRGMCSCCYGPKDLPKRYWRGNVIPADDYDDYTYLLFKNADNGSGHVKRTDEIDNHTCIGWEFPMEKMEKICRDLQEQLGDKYVVLMPTNTHTCISIYRYDYPDLKNEIDSWNYIDIRKV